MRYRRLGQTNLDVSVIGFGCWAIGGHGYGSVDDRESIRAIHCALDKGINFFDTADVYGFGHSEEVLGRALGSDRNRVIVGTKFGVAWDGAGKTYKNCSPSRVVAALDASLKRLQLDCIPLYQIHWYDEVTPLEDIMEALEKCQKVGKIANIGCSNFSIDLVSSAQKLHRLESLQCPYNPLQRESEKVMVEVCNEYKMATIAYGLLGRGLLSNKYNSNTEFGENDTRRILKERDPEQFKRMLDSAAILTQWAIKYGVSASQLLIRLALRKPEITCGLVGMITPEHVKDCVGALLADISCVDLERLDRMLNRL